VLMTKSRSPVQPCCRGFRRVAHAAAALERSESIVGHAERQLEEDRRQAASLRAIHAKLISCDE